VNIDLYDKYNLKRIVNACGKMTHLSGAAVLPPIVEQVTAALPCFFDLNALQERAGSMIAEATGAEAGCVTASSAAGITLSVAAAMTGSDLGRIAQLPDTGGMPDQVVVQKGHAVNFGAPITQMIRLAGARAVEIGSINGTSDFHLEHAINPGTAAVVFVVSHHTVQYGCIPLKRTVEIAHAHDVPVIVDGAAQSFNIRQIIETGVDLAICSGHKYLCGTTAGIVCGREDLVRSVNLQNRGIGRPMKVGKEGIIGVMAALEHRMNMDVDAWEAEQDRKMHMIIERLQDIDGVTTSVEPDPNGNPFSRARVDVNERQCSLSAATLSSAMADGDPSIRLRAHHVDEGYVTVDAIEMSDDEVDLTCERLIAILRASSGDKASLRDRFEGLRSEPGRLAGLR
jgi:D-glucosaminate-6-phosphate ammonia-lyase